MIRDFIIDFDWLIDIISFVFEKISIKQKCSVKCGEGRQQREVVCKDNQGFASDECDQALKPSTERKCFSNQNCFVNIYPQNDDQNDRSLTNSIGKRLLKIEPK